jgi:tetratricopeptide (TPR) repeat protein
MNKEKLKRMEPLKVFISYSHDSPEHLERVLTLSDRLRQDGIDSHIDRYEVSPPEGWPRWMVNKVEWADFVLVVCTETYHQRFKGRAPIGQGKSVKWEGAILTQELYDAEAQNTRFVPILFASNDTAHIPVILRGQTYYDLSNDTGYEELYRHLTGQPRILKPTLGKLKPMQPLNPVQDAETIINPFPFDNWTSVKTAIWQEEIIEWFKKAYKGDRKNSMKELLDHVFEIINNIPGVSYQRSGFNERIMKLGEALQSLLPNSSGYEHHQRILELIKLGVHHILPCLFILPKANKEYLIDIEGYSKLLLSAMYFSAGNYEKAKELSNQIGRACFIANSIQVQCAQKMGDLHEAKKWLDINEDLLKKISSQGHVCCCSHGLEMICDKVLPLLKAEHYRLLGTFYQRRDEKKKAERYFQDATNAINTDISNIKINITDDMRPYGVAAGIHYSHGCYWFEQKDYDKAEVFLEKSINILEKTIEKIGENWYAPYFRLAIVKLLLDKGDDSKTLFKQAKRICEDTSHLKDREAPLGLACCILGLEVVEWWLEPMVTWLRAFDNFTRSFPKESNSTFIPLCIEFNKYVWLENVEHISKLTEYSDIIYERFKIFSKDIIQFYLNSPLIPIQVKQYFENFIEEQYITIKSVKPPFMGHLDNLEKALQIQPPLSRDILESYCNDMKSITEYCKKRSIPVPQIVNDFIERLKNAKTILNTTTY